MGQESLSISPGECIATFINQRTGEKIVCGGDTFAGEQELLGEPTLKSERVVREISADGSRDVMIQNMSRAGERDITFLYGDNRDAILSYAQSRIQPIFNLDFYYKYDKTSTEGARIQRHKRCAFLSLPINAIGNDKGYATCKISFGDIAEIDTSTGSEI